MASSGHFEECQGYVLHCYPLMESSLLIHLLTLEHGRIGVIASTGSRKQKAKPQPFCTLGLRLKMRSGLSRLGDYENRPPGYFLSGHGLYAGLYMNEILMRCLVTNEPHKKLFQTYGDTLAGLAQSNDVEPALRRFERALLEAMGHSIIWTADADCADIETDAHYIFSAEEGFIKSAATTGQMTGGDILAISENCFEDVATRRIAKQIMRTAFAPYLGDKPLRARTLFSESGKV